MSDEVKETPSGIPESRVREIAGDVLKDGLQAKYEECPGCECLIRKKKSQPVQCRACGLELIGGEWKKIGTPEKEEVIQNERKKEEFGIRFGD